MTVRHESYCTCSHQRKFHRRINGGGRAAFMQCKVEGCDCAKFDHAKKYWKQSPDFDGGEVVNAQTICTHIEDLRIFHSDEPWKYPRSWTCGACNADFEQAYMGGPIVEVEPVLRDPHEGKLPPIRIGGEAL